MKKIIDFFKKIGILKMGAGAGVYKNLKDAPDEVVFDGESYGNKKKKSKKKKK